MHIQSDFRTQEIIHWSTIAANARNDRIQHMREARSRTNADDRRAWVQIARMSHRRRKFAIQTLKWVVGL